MAKQRHKTRIRLRHRVCALVLTVSTTCSSTFAAAATPTIPGFYGTVPGFTAKSNLPVFSGGTLSGATLDTTGTTTLTINQNAAQATIDWKSFNIAPGNVVIFNQKKDGVAQSQWAALNRIYSADASQIYGSIKADGKVYLINSNGILFGPGSTVDVHSLIASNLNITDTNFKNGKLRFTTAPYNGTLSNDAYVSNYGAITTDSGGTVTFVGPNVVNAGKISAASGKISLIGAQGTGEVETSELTTDATGSDVSYSGLQVAGTAYNASGGKLITEAGGRINMYGATVRNDGLIRAVTAFKKGGVIVLAARDKVTTGLGSVIESPIDASTETADAQFVFNHPEITVQGLNTGSFDAPNINSLSLIDHQGTIIAPSGNVTLTAKDKIFLGDSSSINVAGLWLDRAASANLMEAQLNSVELSDAYGQKQGELLGQKIYVDVLTGSNIGNLKNNYLTLQSGSEERSTKGGNIILGGDTKNNMTLEQLIIKQGAQLDFSGGGISYAGGTMATSRLISGNKLYNLSSAPLSITYDRLADSQTKSYKRFGITEEFKGLYFGGGSSVQDLTAGRVVGSDAGSVIFNARVAALEGTLTGNVTRGLYQTNVTSNETKAKNDFNDSDYKNYRVSLTRGLEEPVGGTVTVGTSLPATPSASTTDNEQDFTVNAITVKSSTTPLATNFGANDDLNRQTTEISTSLLNSAGLSSLNLFANTSIKTEAGAGLSLLPGGSYVARTRRIEFGGSIDIPGGSVEMTIRPNASSYESLSSSTNPVNTLYQPLIETIYLAAGSRISTAGQQIDNSASGMALHPVASTSHTAGGTILIQEMTEQGTSANVGTSPEGHSVVVAAGALLDVSGGYSIDAKGAISGGNAGTLELKGSTLSLGGELRGFSLPGKTGGEIKLHAGNVLVTSRDLVLPSNMPVDATIPDYLLGKLVLGEDRLKDTGFSRISLTAINDVTFSDGAVLTPSLTKLPMPVPSIVSQGTKVGNTVIPAGYDSTVAEYLGSTSNVTLTAGDSIYKGGITSNNDMARIDLQAGTGIAVAPGGKVTLVAPYIDIAGRIEALGGTVTATANQGSLTVKTGGAILAGGYNKPVTTTVAGLPAGSLPQAGGTVTLQATSSAGDIVMEAGSLVDVSGSAPVERLVSGTDGKPVKIIVAGDPGSLSLSYGRTLALDGEIDGNARMNGVKGGTLSVTNSTSDLKILAADINRYQSSGFDALTFRSTTGAIVFSEELGDLTIGRSLTLDGVSIKGEQGVDVKLRSPWITVINTPDSNKTPASGSATTGTASLSLLAEGADGSGGFLDVAGSVRMDGFSDVTLQAGRDIRFSDKLYSKTSSYAGDLIVSGNLTLQAARVYPTTGTDFTITSTSPDKVVTIQHQPGAANDTTPVYSAGGNLTISSAGGIKQRGTLEAPQGSITLDGGAGEVVLADGSSTTTTGNVSVSYGSYDGSTWKIKSTDNFNGGGSEVTSGLSNSVTLKGKDVTVSSDAMVDVSGGGSIYSAFFQSGLPGTRNPLPSTTNPTGRYVILTDNSVKLPGNAVYLDAAPELGLKAGVYSLLPAEQFAFVPGALVVQNTGIQLAAGQKALTSQGYTMVAGYGTVTDTQVSSQAYTGYSVRSAADVRMEGDFTIKSFTSGNGGDFTLSATNVAVLNGAIKAQPLQGYQGGILTLDAKHIVAQNGIGNSTQPDTLVVNSETVSVAGFGEVALGSKEYSTDTVTVRSGAELEASSVTLRANTSVTIEDGATVKATGGIATVDVPNGIFNLGETSNDTTKARILATNGLRFNVGTMTLSGLFGGISSLGTYQKGDHGSFSLEASTIGFANNSNKQATINGVEWANLTGYDDLTLVSRGDMSFQQSAAMDATKGTLTLDAHRYIASPDIKASFAANGKLTLLNSGAAPSSLTPGANNSSLKLSGAGIDIIPGNGILFDQFGTVTLESSRDVTLRGAGTVTTANDLNIIAPRVTTSYYKYDADPTNKTDVSIPYIAADITINAGGNVIIAGNGGTAGATSTPGGSLEIRGASITVGDSSINPVDNSKNKYATVLESSSGQVKLTAVGDIKVLENASILATGSKSPEPKQPGYSYSPGGSITLESTSGAVALASGSTLDVQASDQGDSGAITLAAATKGVTMSGTIKGSADNGQGGSFAIESLSLGQGGLDGLSTVLSAGGFKDKINIHSRSGDLTLAADKNLTGREVVIAADGGSIDLSGKINTDGVKNGDTGGRVELYAGTSMILENGSAISAIGAGADGGTVSLSSRADDKIAGNYALQVRSGSKIDVSGGAGGTVSFRAYQINGNSDVNISPLDGVISGASRVSVEAARSYTVKPVTGASNVNIGESSSYTSDANLFMNSYKTKLFENVSAADQSKYHLQAGIEISSAAGTDMTLDKAWDLSERPGGEAGIVTLRSGGNLLVNQNLIDAPHGTDFGTLYSNSMKNSWGINLVSGARNAGSANFLATETGTGDLTIAGGKTVYTENAPITFSAGRDVTLNGTVATTGPGYMINNAMKYNLGSYGGTVRGVVGNDLNLMKSGSAIQTALGAIDIKVGGDLNLGNSVNTGAIRTTGEYDNSAQVETMPGTDVKVAAGTSSYWTYHNGGGITLDVGGTVAGNLKAANGWDGAYIDSTVGGTGKVQYPWYLAAGFGGKENSTPNTSAEIPVTVGIATMGGGDISVRSGGSLLTQVGAFGTRNSGNLNVTSGGDMTGRFRAMNGTATLTSGGGFGKDDFVNNPTLRSVIEMADAQVSVAAQGDVHLGAVLNPDNSRDAIYFGTTNQKFWNMTYANDSRASISSLAGDVSFYGTDGFNGYTFATSTSISGSLLDRQRILPATFTMAAAGDLNIDNKFYLAPSNSGNLGLYAVGGIYGSESTSGFKMVDVGDVNSYYGRQADSGSKKSGILSSDPDDNTNKSKMVDHRDDLVPVTVMAGNDIDTLKLVLNKKAEITAGVDINKLDFIGQNNSVGSVTLVSALGSINQGIIKPSTPKGNLSEIVVGGPGTLLVEAGKDINLGNSQGIESIGNKFNSGFTGDKTDSNIIISAGAKQRMLSGGNASQASDFFTILRQAGDDYSNLKAAGKNDEALLRIEDARTEIRKYFDEPNSVGDGSITMIKSLIRSKKGDIYLMARGEVNVGNSDLSDSAGNKTDTGITTTFGGKLNIYTGGDLNVNSSRTMTFMGGDIIIWSDQGDINAGLGSKTSLSGVGTVNYTYDPVTGVLTGLLYPAPALGSGVRASTYDPDGLSGPIIEPKPGDIYLFAPKGIIDAGEAGIAGGKITLGATQVLNTKNISFSAGSVGVPSGSDSSVSLGALGGNSNLADSSKMIETASSGGISKDSAKQKLSQAADDFLSKYLDVKVIGFDAETIPADDKDTPEDLKKGKRKK